jgi:hypothetical protein
LFKDLVMLVESSMSDVSSNAFQATSASVRGYFVLIPPKEGYESATCSFVMKAVATHELLAQSPSKSLLSSIDESEAAEHSLEIDNAIKKVIWC